MSSNFIPKLKIDRKLIFIAVLAVAGIGVFGMAGSAQAVREYKASVKSSGGDYPR